MIEALPNFYVVPFRAEEIDPNDRFPRETKKIRTFINRHGDDALLVKSEQGKPELKEVFVSFLNELVEKRAFFALLIDLDGKDHTNVISDLNSMVQERYPAKSGISVLKGPTSHPDFIRCRCEVSLGGEYSDTFGIVAFLDSLESTVGIQQDDQREICRQKIHDYIINNPRARDEIANAII